MMPRIVMTPGMVDAALAMAALGASQAETARALNVSRKTLHWWAKAHGAMFTHKPGRLGRWTLAEALEGEAARRMLGLSITDPAQLRARRDDLLLILTSRPEPERNKAAALAKLEAA